MAVAEHQIKYKALKILAGAVLTIINHDENEDFLVN